MLYFTGAEANAWYASFKETEHWSVADECHVTRRELRSYEERGRQMEQFLEMEPPANSSLPHDPVS